MRQKYAKFDHRKINAETIRIARELKQQLPPGTKTARLKDPNPNYVPVDKQKFLEWMSLKYLNLLGETGIPLLKRAFFQQYHIEDEFKLCAFCQKPFEYTRSTARFCSQRCRVRYYRYGPRKKVADETLSAKTKGKQTPENSKIGILSLVLFFSVTKMGCWR